MPPGIIEAGVPALAAEVVWRGSIHRDYVTKREEHLAYGLLEYWIVNPLERKVTVLTRRGDVWDERVVKGDESSPAWCFPGSSPRSTSSG